MSHASGIAALIKYLLKLKLKTYLLLCGCETAENCHFKKDFINKLFHFRGACTAKQMLFFLLCPRKFSKVKNRSSNFSSVLLRELLAAYSYPFHLATAARQSPGYCRLWTLER